MLSIPQQVSTRQFHARHDGLGSTTALTNESGAATSTLLYDAWGNQRAATGTDQGRYRFTGAELDAATGLYHMGARFYDPTIGRWLSEDPVQDQYFEPATLNFYAYVMNNPILLADPTGRGPFEDDVEAARKAGEERGKRQVEDRRAREAIDRAAEALRSELARFGINITIEQARRAVLDALARANAGRSLPTDWGFRLVGGGTLLAISATTGVLVASHFRHARGLEEFLITVFVDKAFVLISLLSGLFGYNTIRPGDPLKSPHRRR